MSNRLALESVSTTQPAAEQPSAPPKQRVTEGMSNPFGGTSWGE